MVETLAEDQPRPSKKKSARAFRPGRCPKCGSRKIRVRWHHGGYSLMGKNVCGQYDAGHKASEHLHCYCQTCLFDWSAAPLGKEP